MKIENLVNGKYVVVRNPNCLPLCGPVKWDDDGYYIESAYDKHYFDDFADEDGNLVGVVYAGDQYTVSMRTEGMFVSNGDHGFRKVDVVKRDVVVNMVTGEYTEFHGQDLELTSNEIIVTIDVAE